MSQTFRRNEHVRRRRDFQQAYTGGVRLRGRYLTVFVLGTSLAGPRLGVTATRKLGGSVKRNRAKRLIREIFRANKPARPVDVVVLPASSMFHVPLAVLEADYRSVMARTARLRASV